MVDYLRKHGRPRKSEIAHFLMGYGIQEWAEKEYAWHFERIDEEEYLDWKTSYDPADAGKPTAISTGTR